MTKQTTREKVFATYRPTNGLYLKLMKNLKITHTDTPGTFHMAGSTSYIYRHERYLILKQEEKSIHIL